jgi:hypothetical protein
MRCFGQAENDRICDLCTQLQPDYAEKCRQLIADRLATFEKLDQISKKCCHRYEQFQDREVYSMCRKKPYPYNQCNPCEECLAKDGDT